MAISMDSACWSSRGCRAELRSARNSRGRAAAGYTLVVVGLLTAMIGIALAVVLPKWSTVLQREKEQELIFRGMQYAEAIRVFQQRFNRLPTSLDELIEVDPRSIRQLWEDPMSEDGRWELVRERGRRARGTGSGPDDEPGRRGDRDRSDRETDDGPAETESEDEETLGPIRGVRSGASGESFTTFNGQSDYGSWEFTIDMVPVPQRHPETGILTRARSDWVGRPFDSSIQIEPGSGPGEGSGPEGKKRDNRRPRGTSR